MATNEIFKYGQWLSLPLPLRGDDPARNEDPTRNGDPVLIGDIVGFAQEVGGVPVVWPNPDDPNAGRSTVTFAMSRNTANSREPMTMGSGTPVGIRSAEPAPGVAAAAAIDWCAPQGIKAKLVANSPEDHWFGVIVGQTKMPYPVDQTDPGGEPIVVPEGTYVPIVNIVQTMEGRANPVPDKMPQGS